MIAWRIVHRKFVDVAFTGEGARLFPGRWNQSGEAAVYVAGSLALAALELFVHVQRDDDETDFVSLRVDIPDELEVETIADLPRDWDAEPPLPSTRALGSAWLARGRTLLLRVPSALIPQEHNYLVNPLHREFRKLKIGRAEPFRFAGRMWK